jgi:hypothetical protein
MAGVASELCLFSKKTTGQGRLFYCLKRLNLKKQGEINPGSTKAGFVFVRSYA